MPRPAALTTPLVQRRLTATAAAAFGALVVVGAASPRGGYFPTSWGWIALGIGAAAIVALVLDADQELGTAELVAVGLLGLFVGWVALSAVWSRSLPATILEVERDLIYPLALLAALLVLNRGGVRFLLGGTLLGIAAVCSYALATRLLPERVGTFDAIAGYRLSAPVGYWNGLGAFAAIGVVLALGFAAHGRLVVGRMLAAASLVILLPTLYFTYSRGAWIALGVGGALAVALDPRRVKLVTISLAAAAPAAVAVWLGSRSKALTHEAATFARAEHDGHVLLAEIGILALCAGALVMVVVVVERFAPPGRTLERAWATVLAAVVVGAVVVGVVHFGGPTSVVRKGYRSFTGPPITVSQSQSLTSRLFTLSNSGRIVLWRAAWHDYLDHPLLGSGAGTYEEYYLQHRADAIKVRNAHSLYLEELADLGPVGLALLVAALLVPLAAAVRARRHRLVPVAAGAYGVYLVHAGGDWDWQLVGVTLPALVCAAALLRAGRGRTVIGVRTVGRAVVAAAVLVAVAFAVVAEIGNTALAAAGNASASSSWRSEISHAQRASAWAPWSSEALRLLAEGQYSLGRSTQARATLDRAIAFDPHNWQLWLDLAVVTNGSTRRAAFERALRLDPHGPEVLGERSALGLGAP